MRIGIIGAGQLGQMLGEAARELGHECLFLDPSENPPASTVGEVVCAAFDDAAALADIANRTDVITYEFENVPVDALRELDGSIGVFPPLDALEQAQDRLKEKRLFESLDIPLPAYRPVDSVDDLERAASDIGLPLVLKTRRFGYDGKGQFVLRSIDDCARAVEELGGKGLIAEAWVPFDFEVSVIGVRSQRGAIAVWPLTENRHDSGILSISRAPLLDSGLDAQAGEYVSRMLEQLDYVGVLALELFVADGKLLANEFAPRVHNSGHWTIEGAQTSQFANHILAVVGEGPRPTDAVGHAGMLNLIGEIPEEARDLDMVDATLHDYGKSPRPGRKLGHITVVAASAEERDGMLEGIL